MAPIDDATWLVGYREICLAEWLACTTLTRELLDQILPAPLL